MRRRKFLQVSGTGVLALVTTPFMRLGRAVSRREVGPRPTLVAVYLRGGMDHLNVVVPYADPAYYKMRPTIAIPREGGESEPGVIKLDERFGLHPALRALKPFYDAKRVAPIVNTGSHHPTRSHFDAQDFMEYGAPGLRTVRDGWLNRYLQATAKPGAEKNTLRALAMQGLLPRSLRGRYPVLAVPENVKRRKGDKVLDLFRDLYGCEAPMVKEMRRRDGERRGPADEVVATGRSTIETLEKFKEIVRGPAGGAQVEYPRGRVASRLRSIARVIKAEAGLEVAAVDIGGWDHHAREGGTDGRLSTMLRNLGDSLAAFMSDLGPHLERTVVLVTSEFGRTCRENGNAGTDHGHGGLFLVMGGKVRGGKVHGRWLGLRPRNMYQGRDLPVTTDFRDVFAEVLAGHLGFKVPRGFFPGYKPRRGLGLL